MITLFEQHRAHVDTEVFNLAAQPFSGPHPHPHIWAACNAAHTKPGAGALAHAPASQDAAPASNKEAVSQKTLSERTALGPQVVLLVAERWVGSCSVEAAAVQGLGGQCLCVPSPRQAPGPRLGGLGGLMGRWVNAKESSSCRPHSRVTLALGQSRIYKPERDLSGLPSLPSLSSISRETDAVTTSRGPGAWPTWEQLVCALPHTGSSRGQGRAVPSLRERVWPRAEGRMGIQISCMAVSQ